MGAFTVNDSSVKVIWLASDVIWPLIILPNPAIVVYVHPLAYLLLKHWHKDVEEDYTVRRLCALKKVTVMEARNRSCQG
jgi:hypothetical protein